MDKNYVVMLEITSDRPLANVEGYLTGLLALAKVQLDTIQTVEV